MATMEAANSMKVALYEFDVDQYVRMHETGVFRDEERVELLDGVIRTMSPIGTLHAQLVDNLNELISHALYGLYRVRIQLPILLSRRDLPQPDIAVVRRRPEGYSKQHPAPDDVWLLIEVSDSSLDADREEKLPRYAAAGIREVWIVDCATLTIEQYSHPSSQGYQDRLVFAAKQQITSVAVPELTLSVDEMVK